MLSIENSIDLEAPPWRVWAALTRLDAYARWHPYVTAAGTPEVGRDVDYSMRSRIMRRPITAPATVTCLSEPEAFAWRVGVGGLLRFDESFHIEASEHGATLRHVMECRGVLTRVIPGLDRRLRDFVGGADQALDRHLRGAASPPPRQGNRSKRRADLSRARNAPSGNSTGKDR